jgi:predicted phage tail protein
VTITQPGRYTIWLQAISDTGFTSEWSAGTAFDVAAQPLVMSYENGTLTWTNTGASSYRVWVNNSSGQRVVHETLSSTSLAVTLPPGRYKVWVKADAEPWSNPVVFNIYHAAVTVNPLMTLDTTPLITWNGPADGEYLVWVSVKGQTASVQRHTVTGNTLELSALSRGDYTVWVRQLYGDGSVSLWGSGALLAVGTRPVATLTGTVLSWTPFEGSDHYELWLSTDANTDRIVIDPTNIFSTSVDLTIYNLTSGNYRIWVRAVSASDAVSQWAYAKAFVV